MLKTLLATLVILITVAACALEPTPVVVTTDCGADMDDQWALAHAALSPQLRTLAVITSFAPEPHNLGSADTAQCAREAMGVAAPLAEIPVHKGADRPLRDRMTPSPNQGVDRLLELARAFSRERRLLVLAFGPATDIASALLLDPTLAERIEVVALAFDRYPEGGDGWNVRSDIAAWQVLLDTEVPVAVVSGYTALQDLNLTRAEATTLLQGLGPRGAYLACLHGTWLDAFGEAFAHETGGPDRWPVWDEAVVAVALGWAKKRELPRPALVESGSFAFPNVRSDAPFRWVVAVDRARLFGDLVDRLGPQPSAPAPASGVPFARRVGWMSLKPCPIPGGP
jgi:inosine-uridine nucleoside N-ribohydrolase